jgi:hypothetical protein
LQLNSQSYLQNITLVRAQPTAVSMTMPSSLASSLRSLPTHIGTPKADLDPPLFDLTTIISLFSVLLLLSGAYFASIQVLGRDTAPKLRVLFIWHLFDALIHIFLEGSFLANCFLAWTEIPQPVKSSSGGSWFGSGNAVADAIHDGLTRYTPPGVYWLGDQKHLYGSEYGTNPFAQLWKIYARADKRWGGTDLTVISLEMLTVFIGAPIALYVCYLIMRGEQGDKKGLGLAKYFWMTVLATGELYGGFMTFAPEWLTGNPNLVTTNWMYL